MFIIKYLIVAVLLLPLPAFASDWSVPTKVVEINTGYKSGMIIFRTEQPHLNPSNTCNGAAYATTSAIANIEQILSVLLAAQRSGALVQVGVDSAQCAASYIAVTRIRAL